LACLFGIYSIFLNFKGKSLGKKTKALKNFWGKTRAPLIFFGGKTKALKFSGKIFSPFKFWGEKHF